MSFSRLIAFARRHVIPLPLLISPVFYTGCDVRLSDTGTNAIRESVTLTPGKSLTFTAANGFAGILGLANATVNPTGDGLKIHALNGDPQIILPTLKEVTPGNKLNVHVQIVSPGQTNFPDFLWHKRGR